MAATALKFTDIMTSGSIVLRNDSTTSVTLHNTSAGVYFIDTVGTTAATLSGNITLNYGSNGSAVWVGINDTASTGTTRITVTGNLIGIADRSLTLKQKLRSTMKNNVLIKVNSRQRTLQSAAQAEEQRARMLLRDMLSEQDWRRYITNGFIMVKGHSGYWYQIFAQTGINVYHNGQKVNYICIHTDKACPPTDHVINMKLLVEYDEMAIWKGGNVRNVVGSNSISFSSNSINTNLLDYYKNLKRGIDINNSPLIYSVDANTLAIAC